MTKRQALLRLRDDTETQLSALQSEGIDISDSSEAQGALLATELKDLSGVVSLLDVRLARRDLARLKH